MATVNENAVVSGCDGGRRPGCITSHVVEGSMESYRFYLSRRTAMEMLSDRGCDVSDSDLSLSLTEFHSQFGPNPDLQQLSICVSLRSTPSKKIVVIFCGTEEIRKQTMCGIYAGLPNKENIHRLILVLQSKMNSYARKELEKYPFKVETFHICDLLVNITKHALKPKLEILTAEEKNKLLRKYNWKTSSWFKWFPPLVGSKLPQMLETDGIARYYGLEKGKVVKVTYRGGVIGSHKTYRCVV
ncbi:DNA-directed RNA polymerase V subunit 5C [Prunus yedoensis var. nudiflora]|uniref:DNA-directed RNA polymerase V subunit 5C n=1 Tax=Prunus yedoensis var. nudiflora TaxID=2094558 RepID=A0A315AL00_PRUYE|nr:DNA-directed RNA polymerase V subunit 5C [Prunus yedoensis var. nudiflora]